MSQADTSGHQTLTFRSLLQMNVHLYVPTCKTGGETTLYLEYRQKKLAALPQSTEKEIAKEETAEC